MVPKSSKKNYGLLLIVFMAIVLFNSCKILTPTEMLMEDANHPISSFEPSKMEYEIQPYDILSIRVVSNTGESFFGTGGTEASVSRQRRGFTFPVEYDGLVKFPVLGRIPIAGYTIREAEAFLEEEFGKYFVNPFVFLTVTNRRILIFQNKGASATTMAIPSDRFTLIEAIAGIGGLSGTSKAYRIKLLRGDITDNPKIYYWNIRTLADLQGSNILLEANDIIYIDSRPQYVNRVLREISPYLTLITTALSVYGIFFRF